MNLKAEKEKIQRLNMNDLSKYEANNRRLLAQASARVQEAKRERLSHPETFSGIDGRLIKVVRALSDERDRKELDRAIQRRKLDFLTPKQKAERAARINNLKKRLELLKA